MGYIAAMASVVHVVVGLGNGGAEKTLEKVCSLDGDNHHTIISLTGSGFHGPVLRSHGGHVHCMGLRWWRLFSVLKAMRGLRCLDEADIVTAWMPHAILLAPLYLPGSQKPKLLINLRASSYGGFFVNLSRLSMLGLWFLIFQRRVEGVVTPGETTSLAYRRFGLGDEKFVVIHNGFESGQSPSVEEQNRNSGGKVASTIPAAEIPHIGMFARWHPQKNHAGFLRALALLSQTGRDFRVILAGSDVDSTNKKLVRLVTKYGLGEKVELVGELKDIGEVSRRISVHVLASSFGEAFPNVVAETMLSGIPNIVTDVGDSALIVGNTGWIVEPNDAMALFHALKDATEPGANLVNQGELARKRILSNFPIDKMVKSYSGLYRKLAS